MCVCGFFFTVDVYGFRKKDTEIMPLKINDQIIE